MAMCTSIIVDSGEESSHGREGYELEGTNIM